MQYGCLGFYPAVLGGDNITTSNVSPLAAIQVCGVGDQGADVQEQAASQAQEALVPRIVLYVCQPTRQREEHNKTHLP